MQPPGFHSREKLWVEQTLEEFLVNTKDKTWQEVLKEGLSKTMNNNDEPTFDAVFDAMEQQEETLESHSVQVGWGLSRNADQTLGVVSLDVDNIHIEMDANRASELGSLLISTAHMASILSHVSHVLQSIEDLDHDYIMNSILESLRAIDSE